MYGIVLATMMTTGTAAPDFFHKHGCHGCYGCGCYGCGCWGGGCWGGCCGCYGGGCYGCGCWGGGCHGCWGCCGGYSCHGCYGGGCWGGGCWGGCCGGYGGCCGCYGGCYGGCCGGYGGYGVPMGAVEAPMGAPVEMAPPPTPDKGNGKGIEGDKEVNARRPATVVVKADTDMVIRVNGQLTSRRAAEETFNTPNLVPGRTYSYTFTAEMKKDGKTETLTKEVIVRAGRQSVVDFSDVRTDVARAEEDFAKVTVVLPEQARLFVNDVAIDASGKKTFETPKLVKGKDYYYTVKAELLKDGKAVTDTRRIEVAAGKAVTVDFTKSETVTARR